VTSGSKVDRIAAVDGPVRRRPAKDASAASTVETSAIAASQAQPAGWKAKPTPPVTRRA
jgi:hypothetical protein